MEESPETLELKKAGTSYTFFVPTDQAFNRLGASKLERIMDDPNYLMKVCRILNMGSSPGDVSENPVT